MTRMLLYSPCSIAQRQRGVVLVIAMIFLIIISLLALSSFNSSTANMRATANMAVRQEAMAAAQSLIDLTLSSPTFASDPIAVGASTTEVDIDGDGQWEYIVKLDPSPKCARARALKAAELEPDDAADLACMKSGRQENSGLVTMDLAGTAGDSLCANTEWNLRVVVQQDRAGSAVDVAVNQGVGIRVLATEAEDYCK